MVDLVITGPSFGRAESASRIASAAGLRAAHGHLEGVLLSEEQIDADLGAGLPSPIGEESPGEPLTRRP